MCKLCYGLNSSKSSPINIKSGFSQFPGIAEKKHAPDLLDGFSRLAYRLRNSQPNYIEMLTEYFVNFLLCYSNATFINIHT